jgi:type II secretory pathway pseudopilin PulG
MTLVEVMMAVSVFALLSAGLWANVSLVQRSFAFNRTSNQNVNQASLSLLRMANGTPDYWGMRVSSRTLTTVENTGVTGSGGQLGWRLSCEHNVEDPDGLPDLLETRVQVWTYNPLTRNIDVNGTVVFTDVEDSYARIENGSILVGIRIEEATGGSDAMMETRIRMRNE